MSIYVVCYEFDNSVWDVCRSFLVSLCILTVSKALIISRTTVIARAWDAICYCVVDVM